LCSFRILLYSTGCKGPSKEKWDGASTRFEDVVALFGADDARPLENFADDLRTPSTCTLMCPLTTTAVLLPTPMDATIINGALRSLSIPSRAGRARRRTMT
jgi:hypothetical protein